jgi:cell filamentation protein
MSGVKWCWDIQDFGFRFRAKSGQRTLEYYQGAKVDEYYLVPPRIRKLAKPTVEELAQKAQVPRTINVITIPWGNYDQRWDLIETADGICINFAGCLIRTDIDRREDEGVARAVDLICDLASQPEPVPIKLELIARLHLALFGDIYPFAGQWRTVGLHKGDGPIKWPLPLCGIQPLMEAFSRDVLARTPFRSGLNSEVYLFASELMNELLAIHPFREGNGRAAFMLGNLVLMQNNLLPLDIYDPRRHREAYHRACEAGRLQKNYKLLADLISDWQDEASERWVNSHE